MTNIQHPQTSAPIIYGLALSTPAHVVDWLAARLDRYRERIGTRWRLSDTTLQAIVTLAWLEGGHTYRELGAGNGVPKSTCRSMIQEGVKVLARRALPLTAVVALARKAGWQYLIVDGVNIPTERIDAQFTKKQHWYSGKHKRHGAAVQTVAAADGELLWVSGVLPGKTVDVRAARRFGQRLLPARAFVPGDHVGMQADIAQVGQQTQKPQDLLRDGSGRQPSRPCAEQPRMACV